MTTPNPSERESELERQLQGARAQSTVLQRKITQVEAETRKANQRLSELKEEVAEKDAIIKDLRRALRNSETNEAGTITGRHAAVDSEYAHALSRVNQLEDERFRELQDQNKELRRKLSESDRKAVEKEVTVTKETITKTDNRRWDLNKAAITVVFNVVITGFLLWLAHAFKVLGP